jgi:hypothetical protein
LSKKITIIEVILENVLRKKEHSELTDLLLKNRKTLTNDALINSIWLGEENGERLNPLAYTLALTSDATYLIDNYFTKEALIEQLVFVNSIDYSIENSLF